MKVAYVFSTSGHTASYKLGQMILPQLEQGSHGVEVVGMMFFDDNTYLLRAGDPSCVTRVRWSGAWPRAAAGPRKRWRPARWQASKSAVSRTCMRPSHPIRLTISSRCRRPPWPYRRSMLRPLYVERHAVRQSRRSAGHRTRRGPEWPRQAAQDWVG
jgi:hypothetical protein